MHVPGHLEHTNTPPACGRHATCTCAGSRTYTASRGHAPVWTQHAQAPWWPRTWPLAASRAAPQGRPQRAARWWGAQACYSALSPRPCSRCVASSMCPWRVAGELESAIVLSRHGDMCGGGGHEHAPLLVSAYTASVWGCGRHLCVLGGWLTSLQLQPFSCMMILL